MKILKNAWIDIAVTAIIGFAVFTGNEAARWAVMVYTPLMVVLKLAAFAARHKQSKIKPQDAGIPSAVFHVLYLLNLAMLTYGSLRISGRWWWVAACWGLIWLLSAASGAKRTSGTDDTAS